jgi:nitrogen fixation/metabolism regulation signal transduction histidine kinase
MKPLAHDRQLQALSLAAGAPALLLAVILLATSPWPWPIRIALALAAGAAWWRVSALLRERALRPWQTLSNLLAALREGDYSFRAGDTGRGDALGQAMAELNDLAEQFRQQRLGAHEATALLRTVMGEMDVALFAFDASDRLCLLNRAGEALLDQPQDRALGESAEALGLAEALDGEAGVKAVVSFPDRPGRWEVRRSTFRQAGQPHRLLVLSDLTRPLREEERLAWQRIIRVLSHEINNSLTPIQSLAGSLGTLLHQEPPAPDLKEDLTLGLGIIASRSHALQRFLAAYAQLAKLPPPQPSPLEVGPWIRRVASLETRLAITVEPGPGLTIQADGDQLDQLLINLLRNAVDAVQDTGGAVVLRWEAHPSRLEVEVLDEGPGLANPSNLFVPFFTTKPDGSGIGLVLSRQIAEAHGGTLTLANRRDRQGAKATLSLPR